MQRRYFAIITVSITIAACGRGPMSQGREDGLPEFSAPLGGAPTFAAKATPSFARPPKTPPGPRPWAPQSGYGKTFTPLSSVTPSNEYLQLFEPSGRPRFQLDSRLKKEFASRLNRREALSSRSERVFAELQRVANREVPTEEALLIMPANEAEKCSEEVDRSGTSPKTGAWSIAVKQTAVRHHFPRVPCAEFVSEMLREAYTRAEVDIGDDFGRSHSNQLIWSETASVAGLRRALLKAGWVPWNARAFVPPIGAIMMNGIGETPGHAFLAAGHRGRFIVDNGAPGGRDLGAGTALKTLKEMYSAGVFFLPPGVNPSGWR